MNNRIFELIQTQNGFRGLLWTEEDKQEFAELIIQECARKLENDGMVEVAMELKWHFGIKS